MKKKLIGADQIAEKVAEIARQLNQDYAGQEVVLVVILKGAFVFVADLIRHLDFPFSIEFIRASSYGMRGTTPGPLKVEGLDTLDLKGKNVLLIDDIFDTGKTLNHVRKSLEDQLPSQIKTLVLLRKKRTSFELLLPSYVCFDIEDHFVVGYGLDYKEHDRGLKEIYTIT